MLQYQLFLLFNQLRDAASAARNVTSQIACPYTSYLSCYQYCIVAAPDTAVSNVQPFRLQFSWFHKSIFVQSSWCQRVVICAFYLIAFSIILLCSGFWLKKHSFLLVRICRVQHSNNFVKWVQLFLLFYYFFPSIILYSYTHLFHQQPK